MKLERAVRSRGSFQRSGNLHVIHEETGGLVSRDAEMEHDSAEELAAMNNH